MLTNREAFNELCYDTLSRGDAEFIHQYVVDAFGAQEAMENDKPIRLVFSLVGLYLHVECGFTGREVQLAHMKLGQIKQKWPRLAIPDARGEIDAAAVLAKPIGDREAAIHQWCCSVWKAFSIHRSVVVKLLEDNRIGENTRNRKRAASGNS